MRTTTVNIYRFSELSEQAKQRAKDDYAAGRGYLWAGEAIKSLERLAEHFGGRLRDYSVSFFNAAPSSAEFDMPEMSREEIEHQIAVLGTFDAETLKGHGVCTLTGYCADEDALDGFRVALYGGESDLGELMQAAFDSWLADAQADCADFYTDATFGEHCEANGYEFDESGKIS